MVFKMSMLAAAVIIRKGRFHMRQLSFCSYLRSYLMALTFSGSAKLRDMAKEAGSGNYRLRAPLLLYAVCSGQEDYLLRLVTGELKEEYLDVTKGKSKDALLSLLADDSPLLPNEYRKVWKSYLVRCGRYKVDEERKEKARILIRHKMQQLGVSTYRLSKDLGLDVSNVNYWLKHGDPHRIKYKTATAMADYLRSKENKEFPLR